MSEPRIRLLTRLTAALARLWFILTLTSRSTLAQDCCPNTYVTCGSGLSAECNDGGYFMPGEVTEYTSYGVSVCEICFYGPSCWTCYNEEITAVSNCCGTPFGWNDYVCCKTYQCPYCEQ